MTTDLQRVLARNMIKRSTEGVPTLRGRCNEPARRVGDAGMCVGGEKWHKVT